MREICKYLYESGLCEVETDPCIIVFRNKINVALDELSELLPSSENIRFLKLDELQDDLEDLLCRNAFECGYHIGLRLLSEALAQEAYPAVIKNE